MSAAPPANVAANFLFTGLVPSKASARKIHAHPPETHKGGQTAREYAPPVRLSDVPAGPARPCP
ncbi:hypothetical protein GCM10010425_40320 [Streptomyces spororaveus]